MAWSTPRTWVALEIVSASVMNTHVRDNFNHLAGMLRAGTAISALASGSELAPYSPGVSVYRTTNFGFAENATVTLTFDAEHFDTHAYHDTVTNNSRLTVPSGQAGKYYIFVSGELFLSGSLHTGYMNTFITKNGSTIHGASNAINSGSDGATDKTYGNVAASTFQALAVADYIEFKLYKETNSTASHNIVGGATGVNAVMFRLLA